MIDLRSRFEIFLKDSVQRPLWQPPLDLADGTRRHITDLKIPIISSVSQLPLLLLHNLGQPSHDAQPAKRVDEHFRLESKYHLPFCVLWNKSLISCRTKFLCNTSGSCETHLLLEGLSSNWGFYFTAHTAPKGVGSSDLEKVLQDLERGLDKITDGNHATAPIDNQKVARHRSLLLLYVRYVCFRVFLECAAAMNGGITENHKRCWLLIQVAPVTLLATADIFLAFIPLAGRASSQYLETAIKVESHIIEQLLPQRSTLFCVLDEAQALTRNLVYFRSDTDPAQGRSILHPIVFEWRLILPNLIVSSTGILMQEVETVIGSVVAKEGGDPDLVTEIGVFDDEDGRAIV